MKACNCGTCEVCVAKRSVLDFAQKHGWDSFEWTACSTICGGEDMWNKFVNTHDLEELQWVLRVTQKHERTSSPAVSPQPATLF